MTETSLKESVLSICAAAKTLEALGYAWKGGELWVPPLGPKPAWVDAGMPSPQEITALLPGPYYMDPPDGGSVSVLEQLQRMAADAETLRWMRAAHGRAKLVGEFDTVSFNLPGTVSFDDAMRIVREKNPGAVG